MALQFGANLTDTVNFGALGGATLTSISVWEWIYIDTWTLNRGLWNKNNGAGLASVFATLGAEANHQIGIAWNGTASMNYNTALPTADFLTIGKWWFIGISVDTTAAAGEKAKAYVGDLSMVAFASTMAASTEGSGPRDSAGIFYAGSRPPAFNLPLQGRVDWVGAVGNRVLTIDDFIREQQAVLKQRRSPFGQRHDVLSALGRRGGLQPDLSGHGRHGIVTGATLAPGLPVVSARPRSRVFVGPNRPIVYHHYRTMWSA